MPVQRNAERILPFDEIEAYSRSGLFGNNTVPQGIWRCRSFKLYRGR